MAKRTLCTPAGRKLDRLSKERGDPETLERYYSPDELVEVLCSTDEGEDFERDTGKQLDADVLERELFDVFVAWLRENVGLLAAEKT
jgi:hypothetical protein